MSQTKLRDTVRRLKKKVDDKTVVSNWVEFVKWSEGHPDEEPKMTPRFRKWMESIGARN